MNAHRIALRALCALALFATAGQAVAGSPVVADHPTVGAAEAPPSARGDLCFDLCMRGPQQGNESFLEKANRCSAECKPRTLPRVYDRFEAADDACDAE